MVETEAPDHEEDESGGRGVHQGVPDGVPGVQQERGEHVSGGDEEETQRQHRAVQRVGGCSS